MRIRGSLRFPQGLKPRIMFSPLAARLKSCPFKAGKIPVFVTISVLMLAVGMISAQQPAPASPAPPAPAASPKPAPATTALASSAKPANEAAHPKPVRGSDRRRAAKLGRRQAGTHERTDDGEDILRARRTPQRRMHQAERATLQHRLIVEARSGEELAIAEEPEARYRVRRGAGDF